MRYSIRVCISILMMIGWSGTAFPSDDSTTADFKPSRVCSDIAYMDIFQSRHLAYFHTPEFVEAVHKVASGESRFSPKKNPVPDAWGRFAAELNRHLAIPPKEEAGPDPSPALSDARPEDRGLELLKEKKCLVPALIFLASLEYRSWPGNEGVSPIFPRFVRSAIVELDERFAEKCRMAEEYGKRAAAIRAKIAESERLGQENCPPEDLARAKSGLDRACHDALGVRSSIWETDAAFAQVEKIVDGILGR